MTELDLADVRRVAELALGEDLRYGPDVTTASTVPPSAVAEAEITPRQAGVLAGVPVALEVFALVSEGSIEVLSRLEDGARLVPGEPALVVRGPVRLLLTAERTALNLLCHLSGVATLTRAWADAVEGTGARIRDTRKTTPGLRALEKYAVRCGGGFNHRFGLDDAILIKDNHIAVAGGIRPVLERARSYAGHLVKIEIEVDTLAQLREVLDTGLAEAVLLDNMDIATLREAVRMTEGRLKLEASGGVTLDSIAAIAATGVDYASSGALTHSAPNFDCALDIEM
jgi:nicotinate-nucleotide pyrophosphorylase (carboxylating)